VNRQFRQRNCTIPRPSGFRLPSKCRHWPVARLLQPQAAPVPTIRNHSLVGKRLMSGPEMVSTTVACALAGEVVRTFGTVRLRVFGTSMVPSVLPGDLISVQRADLSEISPGEIVLYLRNERLFVHRVVARSGDQDNPRLITRGDRLTYDDPVVSSSEFLGRVTSIQTPDGRWHREVRPATGLSVWERMFAYVVRTSDRAMYLYLRLAKYLPSLFSRGVACRA
jgi:signal peptidase I